MTLGGQEIIVVDDDMSMTRAIERLLAAAGWRVRSFASAEELLASGASADAAVLIFDIKLPGHVRAGASSASRRWRGCATGHLYHRPGPAELRDLARQSGAAAYFTKPFAGRELIQAIRQHLPAA